MAAAPDDPSGQVTAVIRAGSIESVEAAGLANAATGEPLTRESVFYVGSLAKQFVAACAALLVEEGRLDVEEPVTSHVADLPPWADEVRVRHLIHHTSGIPDRTREGPPPPPSGVRSYGDREVMARIRALSGPASPPGARYAYSNRGYQLLAQVIAAVADATLATFAHERLLQPLGMPNSFFRDSESPLPATAARGHFEADDGRTYVEPARFHAVGAGGLWTTADDLARWDAAFYDEGSVATRLTVRGSLDDGTPIHYGWGLSIRSHRGLAIQSHGGSFPGWTAKMVRFPEQRTTVLVLANGERRDVSADAFALADELLAADLDPSAPHADETFDGVACRG
jgi:CubicO group peptidase (beta-lactamase class C family)